MLQLAKDIRPSQSLIKSPLGGSPLSINHGHVPLKGYSHALHHSIQPRRSKWRDVRPGNADVSVARHFHKAMRQWRVIGTQHVWKWVRSAAQPERMAIE